LNPNDHARPARAVGTATDSTGVKAYPPTREAALARIAAVRPSAYARSRNAIEGAVSGLSPYITHGLVSLPEVLAGVTARGPLDVQHKFVYELGWREYFRHVWQFRGSGILSSLHEGLLPEACYDPVLPADIRQAATGVPVIDLAVRTLYDTGYLHNHARMWLASYVVHIRKVHWRVAADWLYGHLLDGDLASNHLSWQWVAGTGSSKPYLFNAENVARYAPASWHSPRSILDQSYEALDAIARDGSLGEAKLGNARGRALALIEPALSAEPPSELGWSAPDPDAVAGCDVWLVHPWHLADLPTDLPEGAQVVGLFIRDFHRAWPWSEQRWRFVAGRMAELTTVRWFADAADLGAALQSARRVRSVADPHLDSWLSQWAVCAPAPVLFPQVDRRCDSFSKWWTRASRGLKSSADLLG
jgi:deoxyribodipyrimidine photo-lyase